MKKSIRRLQCLSAVSFTLLASTGYAQILPPAERMCPASEAPRNAGGPREPANKCFVEGATFCSDPNVLVGQWYLPMKDGTKKPGIRCNLYNPPLKTTSTKK